MARKTLRIKNGTNTLRVEGIRAGSCRIQRREYPFERRRHVAGEIAAAMRDRTALMSGPEKGQQSRGEKCRIDDTLPGSDPCAPRNNAQHESAAESDGSPHVTKNG